MKSIGINEVTQRGWYLAFESNENFCAFVIFCEPDHGLEERWGMFPSDPDEEDMIWASAEVHGENLRVVGPVEDLEPQVKPKKPKFKVVKEE